jgi:Flp pilus assembly protein TadG
MKNMHGRFNARRVRGSAAVEAAIVLPILILFLAFPFFFAQVFWFYSVAAKASHDAARFLSTATKLEVKATAGGFAEAPISALTRQIAQAELTEILPATEGILIDVQCDLGACGLSVPETVRVRVRIHVKDRIFGAFTDELTGSDGMILTSDATMRYAGQ